jgi:hypothetical protein
MHDVDDFNRLGEYPVHNNERKLGQRQFPSAFHLTRSAAVRKGHECVGALVNILAVRSGRLRDHLYGYDRRLRRDRQRLQETSEPPSYERNPLDTLSRFLVREIFAPVELLQALLYLLPEPRIMIDVMLD